MRVVPVPPEPDNRRRSGAFDRAHDRDDERLLEWRDLARPKSEIKRSREIYLEITPWLSFFVDYSWRLTARILHARTAIAVLWAFQTDRAVLSCQQILE